METNFTIGQVLDSGLKMKVLVSMTVSNNLITQMILRHKKCGFESETA